MAYPIFSLFEILGSSSDGKIAVLPANVAVSEEPAVERADIVEDPIRFPVVRQQK